jgi:hypothetical protein
LSRTRACAAATDVRDHIRIVGRYAGDADQMRMRKLSLVTILGLVLAMSTGAAAAATAPTLTGTEYQQLVAFQNDTRKSLKSLAAVEAAQKDCHGLSPVSALMRADRADCNASFDWAEASAKALARVKACAHTKTVAARFSCLLSSYAGISRTVRALYHAELRVYRAVSARGFTGSCLRALSDGPKAIRDQAHMTKDMSKMVSAMRQRNLLGVQKWGGLYDAATAETEAAASHTSMTVCPHE